MKGTALVGLLVLASAVVGCEEQKRESLHGSYMAPDQGNSNINGSGGWYNGAPTIITPSSSYGSGNTANQNTGVSAVHDYAYGGREPVSSIGQPERASAAGVHH